MGDLSGATFTGVDLSGSYLMGVKSGNVSVDLTYTKPTIFPSGWTFKKGYLIGEGADLTGANLSDATLTDYDLTGIDLSNSILTGVESRNISITGNKPTKLPSGWKLIKNQLVGREAKLTSVDLSGEDFANTDLTGVDLSNATLTNVKSGDVSGNFTGTKRTQLPSGWKLINGYLVGPQANLSEANLAGANLSGATLTGANLSNAYLFNTDISGNAWVGTDYQVDLTGATFTDAIYKDADTINEFEEQ